MTRCPPLRSVLLMTRSPRGIVAGGPQHDVALPTHPPPPRPSPPPCRLAPRATTPGGSSCCTAGRRNGKTGRALIPSSTGATGG
eukprot:5294436-Prymnesium_polylepis.1